MISLPICLVCYMASLKLQYGPFGVPLPPFCRRTTPYPKSTPGTCEHWKGFTLYVAMQMLAAGWKALGMVERGDFVGIIGFASMDWLVSDIATTYTGGVMSPLPTNILVEDIKQLILEAEVGMHSLRAMLAQQRSASLRAEPGRHQHPPEPLCTLKGTCDSSSHMGRDSLPTCLNSGCDMQQGSLLVQVRCLMCSPEEMTKLVPIMRECTCVRNVIIMDRQAQPLCLMTDHCVSDHLAAPDAHHARNLCMRFPRPGIFVTRWRATDNILHAD